MNYEEPTQRIYAPRATQTPLPGPLDLTGDRAVDSTEVLPLDELLGPPEEPVTATAPEPVADGSAGAAANAPTWTAMPIVPVRSEPIGGPRLTTAPAAPAAGLAAAPSATAPAGAMSDRVLDDARKAWSAALRRSRAWVGVQDNAIMLATAAVAIVLIIVVALLGH